MTPEEDWKKRLPDYFLIKEEVAKRGERRLMALEKKMMKKTNVDVNLSDLCFFPAYVGCYSI